jgi:hypothetical protein
MRPIANYVADIEQNHENLEDLLTGWAKTICWLMENHCGNLVTLYMDASATTPKERRP